VAIRGASGGREKIAMRLAKRVLIALGSLAALMLAGGAHFKVT
jgi:hypothetical protein